MGRAIPIGIQGHLDSGITTTTALLKISPVTPGFAPYGLTFGNTDVVYDDGNGEIKYSAAIGMQPTAVGLAADLSVDNAESTSLLPEFEIPVSEADIRAGVYDFARFSLYLVNYDDLTQGHVTLQEGTIGQVTIDANGLSFVNELRGLVAQLKQSVCEKDSLTCRALFGSQPIGSVVPGPQVRRGWCGFDATTILKTGTVIDVGLENTVSFRVTPDMDWSVNSFSPGSVKFLTGMNAGRSFEVDSNTSDGWFVLRFDAAFPIADGDTLEYRADCNKHARDASKGCKRWFPSDWGLHFRGEPDIPIGDAGSMETPGASSGPGQGAPTFEPLAEGGGE